MTHHPDHARTMPIPMRWLTLGGATLLAGILGVVLLLQTGASSACAAPPGSGGRQGKATFYDLGGTGNCSFDGAPADGLFVALGPDEYAGAAACGMYLDVTGPKGKVRVKVIDSCPECAAGHIDLSRKAFGRIADHVTGIVPVTYRAVRNPAVPGPLTVRFKDGTSRWWFAVRLDNHGNALRSVQVKGPGGGWRAAGRKDFNYWVIDAGAGAGPFSLRVTDVTGRTATATGIRLAPEQTQRTSVTLSGRSSGRPERAGGGTGSSGRPSASATPSRRPPTAGAASASATSQPAAPGALAPEATGGASAGMALAAPSGGAGVDCG